VLIERMDVEPEADQLGLPKRRTVRALRKLWNDQSGVIWIEYGLIAALISIGIVSAVDQHRDQFVVHLRRRSPTHRDDVAQHEAAAAAGRLEYLFQMIGHLRGCPGDRPLVAGGEAPAIVEEFLAG